MQFNLRFTYGKLQSSINLISFSDLLKRDFPEIDQFILESLSGPEIDAKQSVLGVGVLLGLEVKNSQIKIHGNPTLVKELQRKLSSIDRMNLLSGLNIVKEVENCAKVILPDETDGKLPLLSVIGYDFVAPESIEYELVSMPDLAIIVPLVILRIELRSYSYTIMSIDDGQLSEGIQNSLNRFLQHQEPTRNNIEIAENIPVNFTVSPNEYKKNIRRCKCHIFDGDIYQIQLGHEVLVKTKGSANLIYKRLRYFNPSPYMFLINLPSVTLIGASPELFVRIEAGKMLMRPLAGTLPKVAIQSNTIKELKGNSKEEAEHIMLVDLCRNDIGRVAQIGTVSVPELLHAEEYSTVFHFVSTISGWLRKDKDIWNAIEACSPAGTMTGTPKIRATKLIAEYEWTRRGLYSGSVVFSDGLGNLVSALIIRTLIYANGFVTVRASSGIVADSDPDNEWHETLVKIQSALIAVTTQQLST